MTLASQRLTALALCIDRRKGGYGPAALGRFLDRRIDQAKAPIAPQSGR
jgi:hypothetical protein